MIRFVISTVRPFRKIIQWFGIDYDQFESLLQVKLTMDFRQKEVKANSTKTRSQTYIGQLIVYSLLGIGVGVSFLTINDILLNLTICYAVIMVMIGSMLISDFSTVLFDPRDNQILLARPVSNRTLLFTRLMHVNFHLGSIALALSLLSSIVLAFKTNVLAMLVFFIGVGLCLWFTVFLTTFIYLALSKMVSGEKFKDLITYVQILLAVLIFGGYQIMPKILDMEAIQSGTMAIHWWTYLVPPAWLAGLVKLFQFSGVTAPVYWLAALGVVVPVAGMAVVIRLLSSGFGNLLSASSENDTKIEKNMHRKRRFRPVFHNLFCISEIEKAGWKLTMATTSRDRKFKQTVYPSFGIFLVFIFMMLKPDFANLDAYLTTLSHSSKYMIFIILSFFLTTGITQLPFTETPEAAWIYEALPVKRKRHLITGAAKALLFKLFTPMYLLVTALTLWIWGIAVLPKMILGYLLIILLIFLTMLLQKTGLPFTQPRDMIGKNTNFLRSLLSFFLMLLVFGLVFATTKIPGWYTYLAWGLVIGGISLICSAIRKEKHQRST